MANLVTLVRLFLLFVLVGMIYAAPPTWRLLDLPLLVAIMTLDALDGYVARKFNESSLFGAVFDIAVDRIVETVLWVVLADIGLAPVWAAVVFIVRGNIVDTIRNSAAASKGVAPFDMMRSRIGRFLVGGRFMRGLYNTVKICAFGLAVLIEPLPATYPRFWAEFSGLAAGALSLFVWLAAILCLVRGVPVVLEFILSNRAASRAALEAESWKEAAE